MVLSPGGPGSSGVEEVAQFGPVYRQILRDQYNVIGFDSRGTGRTIPFSCPNNTTLQKRSNQYINQTVDLPSVDSWALFKNKAWAEGGLLAERCYEAQQDTGRYLSTAFVARDLRAIAEVINDDGSLRFWGWSHGTIIGQTFAAMFPNKSERMVLDSIVEASGY
ncbi:hypothetical protein BST61_g3534 [Cercospora zeina]